MIAEALFLLACSASPGGSGPAVSICLSAGAPHAPHSVASVNDPLSHGVVGDNLLSLNEAIQLHNRTLQVSALSPAEVLQLGGFGTDIAWINIDATWTPTITVERDFDVILDFPHGLLIQGFNGLAVIDFSDPNLLHGFRSVSNFCSWRNLILLNGRYGIDLQQSDASFGGTVLDTVEFDGQSQFSFAVAGTTPDGYGRVLFDQCAFRNTPAAIRCDEAPAGRTTILGVFSTNIAAQTSGIEVLMGSGGTSIYQFDRVRVDVAGTGVRLWRYAGSDRPAQVVATHFTIAAAHALEIQGTSSAVTSLALRMLDLRASSGNALVLSPLGASFAGVVEDSTIDGNSALLVGSSGVLSANNLRFSAGSVQFGSSSAGTLQLAGNQFDGCTVSTAGSQAVPASGICVVGGAVQGTAMAPLQLTNSYVFAAVGPNVSQGGALPAAQLGGISMQPELPVRGGTLTLQADLPPGLFAVFVLGLTVENPLLLEQPLHIYLDLPTALVLGGIYQLQQSLVVPIPNDFQFAGTDWVFQAAVFPTVGVAAPPLHLPPGHRFVIQ